MHTSSKYAEAYTSNTTNFSLEIIFLITFRVSLIKKFVGWREFCILFYENGVNFLTFISIFHAAFDISKNWYPFFWGGECILLKGKIFKNFFFNFQKT